MIFRLMKSVEDFELNKSNVIKKFAINASDTGSAPVQIALLTSRVEYLTDHLQIHHNDKTSRRSLLLMVAKRMKLLKYLKRKDINLYNSITDSLNIKKK